MMGAGIARFGLGLAGPALPVRSNRTVAIATTLAVLAAAVAQITGPSTALAVGLALFLLGVPHGASDEDAACIASIGLARGGAYLLVGLAFAALFLAGPVMGLTAFLGLSAWHFARADQAVSAPVRLAIAALAIGGSVLLRPLETAAIFDAILGAAPPPALIVWLTIIGGAGVLVTVIAILISLGSRSYDGALLVSIALASAALLHPVLAVGLIVFISHALPVQLAQITQHGFSNVRRAIILPSLIAMIGALCLAFAVVANWLALPLAAALALGLAIPHMLTERLDG